MTLKELKEIALRENYKDKPDYPEHARYVKPYSDKKANGLTRCIIDYIHFIGGQAERISVTGRYVDNSKIVTDVIGRQRKIGSGKWIKSSMTKGSADISAIYQGRTFKIEVKIGRDKLSPEQTRYKRNIEKAGGVYIVARTWEQFYNEFQKYTK